MRNSARLWLNAQAMRLFAAFCIAYFHLQATLEALGVDTATIDLLKIGTDSFLILTAFLSVYRNPFNKDGPSAWLWKRLMRIVPLYWFVTLIVFFLKNHFLTAGHHNTYEQLLQSLFFIPYGPRPVLYPGWTLTLIVEFAILLAICHSLFPRSGSFIASLIAGGLGAWGLFASPENPVWLMYTHPILIDFCFGGMLAVLVTRVEKAPRLWLRIWGVASFAGAGIGLFITYRTQMELPRVMTFGLSALLVVAGCVLLECGEWRLDSRWIAIAARYAYCVYLGHIFWDICLDAIARQAATSVTVVLLILTPIAIALGSMLLHHLVELPLRKLTDRLPPWFLPPPVRAEKPAVARRHQQY